MLFLWCRSLKLCFSLENHLPPYLKIICLHASNLAFLGRFNSLEYTPQPTNALSVIQPFFIKKGVGEMSKMSYFPVFGSDVKTTLQRIDSQSVAKA